MNAWKLRVMQCVLHERITEKQNTDILEDALWEINGCSAEIIFFSYYFNLTYRYIRLIVDVPLAHIIIIA